MSRALARLRALLDDPILVRVSGGLAPTARAIALTPALTVALDGLGGVLGAPAFDLAGLDRAFRIAATDALTLLVAPPLLSRFAAEAPRARLVFEPFRSDTRVRMEAGELDLAVALADTPLPPGAFSEPLAEDRLALVMRRDHPGANAEWTLQDYARFDHATVSIFGDPASDIDAELAEAGVKRRIALTTPHFLTALAAVGASDCVTTVSAAIARRFADTFGLVLRATPLKRTRLSLRIVGEAARGRDPALSWFRKALREVAAEVYAEE
jgi:DNA-binding transcriptional LysR family regulator